MRSLFVLERARELAHTIFPPLFLFGLGRFKRQLQGLGAYTSFVGIVLLLPSPCKEAFLGESAFHARGIWDHRFSYQQLSNLYFKGAGRWRLKICSVGEVPSWAAIGHFLIAQVWLNSFG